MKKFSIKYSSVRKLAEQYDIFLFDLDGVCWHGDNGHIGESFRNIEWLESLGKKVFFITNSAARSREELGKKM